MMYNEIPINKTQFPIFLFIKLNWLININLNGNKSWCMIRRLLISHQILNSHSFILSRQPNDQRIVKKVKKVNKQKAETYSNCLRAETYSNCLRRLRLIDIDWLAKNEQNKTNPKTVKLFIKTQSITAARKSSKCANCTNNQSGNHPFYFSFKIIGSIWHLYGLGRSRIRKTQKVVNQYFKNLNLKIVRKKGIKNRASWRSWPKK